MGTIFPMRANSVLRIAAATAIIAACAGFSASPSHPAGPRSGASATRAAPDVPAGTTPPGCSTAIASAPSLPNVRTAVLSVSGNPFGVAATADGNWAFVAVNSSVAVLSTTGFKPTLVRTIPVQGTPEGVALTPDGSYLLVASGSGAIVINVALAESGTANPVVGTLSSQGTGAIEVAFSPDSNFAFVTLEDSDEAAVYNLAKALSHGFGQSDFVGDIPLNVAPVGMAVSPDGNWLYATSEQTTGSQQGTLTVINLPLAETDPAGSVVTSVDAGCGAVRVITSADGSDVWVTARESDALLLFSASALQNNPANALVTWILVGEAPVDMALADQGTRLLVANSNRFNVQGEEADIGVVNVAAAAAGQPVEVGTIMSGLFPRQFALEANGKTLLVSNYASDQVEAVDVTGLP